MNEGGIISKEIHVSGLGTKPLTSLSLKQQCAVKNLRSAVNDKPLFQRHPNAIDDSALVRFLVACSWNVESALKMAYEAFAWRDLRRPDWILAPDRCPEVEAEFAYHARTGKVYVPGCDRYGRAILVFDNSVQNSKDEEACLRYLAYNMELCRRTSAPGVDKICLIIKLDRFSIFNNPKLSTTKETITILTKAYPETLGHCILMCPPAYFHTVYRLIGPLLDDKIKSKVNFILKRDVEKKACLLTRLIGHDWKKLTTWGEAVHGQEYSEYFGRVIDCSPGFRFDEYWKSVLTREAAWLAAHPSPPSPVTSSLNDVTGAVTKCTRSPSIGSTNDVTGAVPWSGRSRSPGPINEVNGVVTRSRKSIPPLPRMQDHEGRGWADTDNEDEDGAAYFYTWAARKFVGLFRSAMVTVCTAFVIVFWDVYVRYIAGLSKEQRGTNSNDTDLERDSLFNGTMVWKHVLLFSLSIILTDWLLSHMAEDKSRSMLKQDGNHRVEFDTQAR